MKEESDGSRELVGQKIRSNGLFVNDIIFWKEKGKNPTSYLGKKRPLRGHTARFWQSLFGQRTEHEKA